MCKQNLPWQLIVWQQMWLCVRTIDRTLLRPSRAYHRSDKRWNVIWRKHRFRERYTVTAGVGRGSAPGMCRSGSEDTDNGGVIAARAVGSRRQQYISTAFGLLFPHDGKECVLFILEGIEFLPISAPLRGFEFNILTMLFASLCGWCKQHQTPGNKNMTVWALEHVFVRES